MGEAGRAGYRRYDARGRGHRIGWTREAGRTGHGRWYTRASEVVHERPRHTRLESGTRGAGMREAGMRMARSG